MTFGLVSTLIERDTNIPPFEKLTRRNVACAQCHTTNILELNKRAYQFSASEVATKTSIISAASPM